MRRFRLRIALLLGCSLIFWAAAGGHAAAQTGGGTRITGIVMEEAGQQVTTDENTAATLQPVIQAAAMLLTPGDSALVRGAMTDGQGRFSLRAAPGSYILKISLLGYTDRCFDIQCTPAQGGMDLGTIILQTEAAFLTGAVVTATANVVSVAEDTLVYNPAAFHLPEDAMLEDLLRKIPGLSIDGGEVTLHGKPISQLLINGERFFSGNVKAGLKSLTADMVEKINAYERESDFTRITGVDDGEREPVLDLKIKKGFLDLWKTQTNLGGGTSDRYAGRINANNIGKQKQTTVVLGQKNISGQAGIGTTGRNQLGTGSAGDRMTREAGISFSRKNKVLNLNGNVHYDGNVREALSRNKNEYLSSTSLSWNNTNYLTNSLNHTVKSDFVLEWRPNKNHTIYLKPEFQYVRNGTHSGYSSAYFVKNPYEYVADPNDWLEQAYPEGDPLKEARSNTGDNVTTNYNHRTVTTLTASWTYRFAKKGRTLSLRTKDSYTASEEDLLNNYRTRYYRIKKNPDSLQIRALRSLTENANTALMFQAAWNEPLGKGFHLQATLRYQQEIRLNDKDYYNIATIDPSWRPPEAVSHSKAIASLPAGYEAGLNDNLSAHGRYDYYSGSAILSLRYVRKKFNMTLGGTFRPQRTRLSWYEEDVLKSQENKYFQFAPNITLRYNPRKTEQCSFTYSNWASLPSMYQLIPVASGTNPLYIHEGNPDLKPAQVHSLSLSYNVSNIKRQQSLILNGTFRLTEDQICTVTSYDHETGIRTTRQGNIDGNWRATASLVFNKTFGKSGWSVSNHTGGEYQNNVAYLYDTKKKIDEVNVAPRLMVKEQFDLNYRGEWFEGGLNARAEYTMERSNLRPEVNGDIFNLAVGASSVVTLPWAMRVSTDFSVMDQRGYYYPELNRQYYIWNASIAQPLWKKKMTLRLEAFDLLGQLSNMTRTFGSQTRSVGLFNGINRYVMLRAIFRLGQTGKAGKK